MNDDKIFANFLNETEQEKKDIKKTVISQEKNIINKNKLTTKDLLIIQTAIENQVRKATSNNTEIFKEPNKHDNKAVIQDFIYQGIRNYKSAHNLYLDKDDESFISKNIWNELVGYGPLEPLLKDESITEIMVINANLTFIERNGEKEKADIIFKNTEHIKRILNKIIQPIGRKIDDQTPTVDARLPQGFRLNAVISPIALNNGVFITIRKFPSKVWKPIDLIKFKSATELVFHFLELCVISKINICVSGGTGSGKTTLLNVLSNCIPDDDRIITIEDCAELKLVGEHILSEEARHPNSEGRGEVSIRDLVKNALRQRPDRIIVGECRGAEALDMLQAMNTGHDGSMTTGHANSPVDFLSRLEYMCMCAGDMPLAAIKPQIASAVGIIVQIGRVRINGKPARKILEIVEVLNEFDENGNYQLRSIFNSKFKGSSKYEIAPTGYLPTFTDILVEDYDFDKNLLNKPEKYIEPQ